METPALLLADATPQWVITAIQQCFPALIWAAVALLALLLFKSPIRDLIERIRAVSFDTTGFKLEAAASLALSTAKAVADGRLNAPPSAAKIAETVERAIPRSAMEKLFSASILWVDDRPNNNIIERNMFEELGLRIELAASTEEALEIIKYQEFAVIISDMGRPPDRQAGYTLLGKLLNENNSTPFVIYSGSNDPDHIRLARKNGAQGSTNNPLELFTIVTGLILKSGWKSRMMSSGLRRSIAQKNISF